MKARLLIFGAVILAGCATDQFAPPKVSPALVAKSDHLNARELSLGRRLFLSRCLECHTLPRVTKYSREQWPSLVNRMSARANLTADEKAAVIAYLRAAAE